MHPALCVYTDIEQDHTSIALIRASRYRSQVLNGVALVVHTLGTESLPMSASYLAKQAFNVVYLCHHGHCRCGRTTAACLPRPSAI